MGAAEKKPETAAGPTIVVTTAENLRALIGDAVREALQAQQPKEGYLDTEQAAAYLGCTVGALQAAVGRGTVVPDHRGQRGRLKSHRFSRKTLDLFLQFKSTSE